MISNHHQKGDIYRAEVNLQLNGELLRVDRTENDLYKAIDKVKDHLAMMIKRYRDKRIDGSRRQDEMTAEDVILADIEEESE
jgi:ribosomal subunit interface protein